MGMGEGRGRGGKSIKIRTNNQCIILITDSTDNLITSIFTFLILHNIFKLPSNPNRLLTVTAHHTYLIAACLTSPDMMCRVVKRRSVSPPDLNEARDKLGRLNLVEEEHGREKEEGKERESPQSQQTEQPVKFDESCFAGPSNSKSILRQAGAARKDKKVRFDLVVLFLDVAYEGQFDALVELASKIDNISVANSEGITALHYAICAGFIESVKFLIEKGADVNAVDIDGWTPLHCAASCTNLVMVRQLIENGACPFATTSKSETAAQLFEESSDYANRAEYMETLEDCMGVINDGKVYTAYAYEAEQDDELTFAEGDELRVLRKSECEHEANGEKSEEDYESEQFWWLCEHCATGQRGLVPRNFLALTPTWKFRSRYPSAIHELPQPGQCRRPETDSAVNNGNKPKGSSPTDQLELLSSKGSSNNNGSSTTSTGAGGHQELSTYA